MFIRVRPALSQKPFRSSRFSISKSLRYSFSTHTALKLVATWLAMDDLLELCRLGTFPFLPNIFHQIVTVFDFVQTLGIDGAFDVEQGSHHEIGVGHKVIAFFVPEHVTIVFHVKAPSVKVIQADVLGGERWVGCISFCVSSLIASIGFSEGCFFMGRHTLAGVVHSFGLLTLKTHCDECFSTNALHELFENGFAAPPWL